MNGDEWISMETDGGPWRSMEIYRDPWRFIEAPGVSTSNAHGVSVDTRAYPSRLYGDSLETAWRLVKSQWTPVETPWRRVETYVVSWVHLFGVVMKLHESPRSCHESP